MLEKPSSIDSFEIFEEKFPDDVSVSDLCDCGLHKRLHPPKLSTERGLFPKSHYKTNFEAVKHPRPRSSKRPPMTPRRTYPLPMCLSTNQKEDFRPLGVVERTKPIIHGDNYESSNDPMDARSYYQQEFTPKQAVTEHGVVPSSRTRLISHEPGTFDGTTTNMTQFKRWVPQPTLSFGELPSFTGSIIFPEKKTQPALSTMRHSYKGEFQRPPPLAKAATNNIQLEGDQSFSTTNSLTYREVKGDHRPTKLVKVDSSPMLQRGRMLSQTQTMLDFPGYTGGQPSPAHPAEPAPETIDLKFSNKQNFSTENRSIYRGHDVLKHPVVDSCKATNTDYKKPTVALETLSSHKRDFQPIDLSRISAEQIKIPQSSIQVAVDQNFDDTTMNKKFFQNWGTQPRIRYGDFHENRPYVPSVEKFSGESVTKATHVGKSAPAAKIIKPEVKPIHKEGAFDFKTVYQEEFQKKEKRMCRAQIYLIQQELKKRKGLESKKCGSAPLVLAARTKAAA